MKILILTQYFPPEVGAPQNRLFELAVRLKDQGDEITVLTAMPNYPKMEVHAHYKGRWTCLEDMSGLKVRRCWIYVTKNKSILPRLMNYFSFVFTSMWIGAFKIPKHDLIICESPPLFLGISALFLKKIKKSKLLFNVSDLWPESAEKLGLVTNKTMLSLAYRLEKSLYKNSDLISGQTQGIASDITTRTGREVYWLPNGVDISVFDPTINGEEFRKKNGFQPDDFIFIYAGIIGHAQGLEVILKAADLIRHKHNIKFLLLGNGPEKPSLVELRDKLGLHNIHFMDFVPKTEMPFAVAAANASIIPLRALELFKGAIPSKIFENLAMERPILLGVDGEARQLFIEEGKCGLYFRPEDYQHLAEQILLISSDPEKAKELGRNGRDYVSRKFNRDKIALNFRNYLHQSFERN